VKSRDPFLDDLLALSPSELTPIWLEAARSQAARRKPADLMAQFQRDRFVAPSFLDQREAIALDGHALAAASGFEAILLSPVAPLGVCSSVAPTSQDRTISAVRALEVVSDPTNVLALECARRLKKDPATTVRLATVHQVVRAQPAPPGKAFSQHFRLFAMVEAGPAQPEDGFEVESLVRHMGVFNDLFNRLERTGLSFPGRRAEVLVTPERRTLKDRLVERLRRELPDVSVDSADLDQVYYDGVRVRFGARATSGDFVPIGDLGVFDWMNKLTANRKRRFVASGFGLQLAPALFGGPAARSSAQP